MISTFKALYIKQSFKLCFNACWKAICPEAVEIGNKRLPLEHEYSQIIKLAHTIGGERFEDFARADIEEILAEDELNEDDLVNMKPQTRLRQ
ncbi:unnamed protein product [Euphydryas editha]|uniref:Uncharacterized protein n=1 Tax=Euphydryas editha TaxID=104508 RepID=A0AAU9U3S9_EUPED|nr:unnamed protein product [Euphydryas editha]